MEGPDQALRLHALHRAALFGNKRAAEMARSGHEAFDSMKTPDPREDLDDSEISDSERRSAIARERWRRQGRF